MRIDVKLDFPTFDLKKHPEEARDYIEAKLQSALCVEIMKNKILIKESQPNVLNTRFEISVIVIKQETFTQIGDILRRWLPTDALLDVRNLLVKDY